MNKSNITKYDEETGHTDRNLAHNTKVYNDLGKKHAIAISHESNNVQYTQQQQQRIVTRKKNVISESENAKKLDGQQCKLCRHC